MVNPAPDCALGADDGTRTRNLLFTKQLLYQLSYVGDAHGLPRSSERREMIGLGPDDGQARRDRR